MARPSQLVFDDHSFNAGGFCLSEDTCIRAAVFPFDVKYPSEAALMVAFQFQQVPAICNRTIARGLQQHYIQEVWCEFVDHDH